MRSAAAWKAGMVWRRNSPAASGCCASTSVAPADRRSRANPLAWKRWWPIWSPYAGARGLTEALGLRAALSMTLDRSWPPDGTEARTCYQGRYLDNDPYGF